MAIVEEGRDEEGDLEVEREIPSPKSGTLATNTVAKQEGLIVFFPGNHFANLLQPYLMSYLEFPTDKFLLLSHPNL